MTRCDDECTEEIITAWERTVKLRPYSNSTKWRGTPKPVKGVNIKTGETREFPSVQAAAGYVNAWPNGVYSNLRGATASCKGWVFTEVTSADNRG